MEARFSEFYIPLISIVLILSYTLVGTAVYKELNQKKKHVEGCDMDSTKMSCP